MGILQARIILTVAVLITAAAAALTIAELAELAYMLTR